MVHLYDLLTDSQFAIDERSNIPANKNRRFHARIISLQNAIKASLRHMLRRYMYSCKQDDFKVKWIIAFYITRVGYESRIFCRIFCTGILLYVRQNDRFWYRINSHLHYECNLHYDCKAETHCSEQFC